MAGPYVLVGRLGSGGMGEVFLGRSAGGRLVAVKVIHAPLAGDGEFRARFAREVAAARQAGGAFTAPVVDADVDGAVPWLATAYVRGPSLGEAVAAQGPLPTGAVAALGGGLAEGLAGIHGAGVVHRDLKPSNVLLAEDGPRVIDFGISRAAEASALTRTGLVVGSPGFMAPEQAAGGEVGPAADVFALGAVLVFAATGEGPFGTGSVPALLYRVVHADPDLARVPESLRPLAARCLAKDPADRPGTSEIVAGLARLRPAAGTRPGEWLPAGLFHPPDGTDLTPPHPATATAAATPPGETAPPADISGTAAPTSATHLRNPATATATPPASTSDAATRTRGPAGTTPPPGGAVPPARAARPARRRAWIALAAAITILAATAVGTLLARPRPRNTARPSTTTTTPATTTTTPAKATAVLLQTLTDPASKGVNSVAFSPGGKLLATSDQNGTTYLWNISSHTRITTLTDPASKGVNSVAFSPGGKLLATADQNGRAYLWDIATRTRIAALTDPASQGVNAVAFSPNGETLATSSYSGIYLWDIATRARIAALTGLPVYTAAFSPNGKTLATSDDSDAYLWNVANPRQTVTLTDPFSKGVYSVAFSPNGKILAAANDNGTYLWNVTTRTRIAFLADPASQSVYSVAFSPNGKILAAGDGYGRTYLWNVTTRTRIAVLTDGSPVSVNSVAFSPNGKILATGDYNGSTYLWSVSG